MSVSYLGISLNTLSYVALLLFGLIIFLIILILTEKDRQRRHKRERLKVQINNKY